MTEPIAFSTDPTLAEFRVSARTVQRRHRWLIVLYLALGASIGFSLVLGTSVSERAAALATLVLIWTIYIAWAGIQSSRLREMWTAWNDGDRCFSFSEEGVIVRSSTGIAELSWSAFDRFATSKDVLTCVLKPGSFMCIPRRNIPDARASELLALLDREVTQRSPAG